MEYEEVRIPNKGEQQREKERERERERRRRTEGKEEAELDSKETFEFSRKSRMVGSYIDVSLFLSHSFSLNRTVGGNVDTSSVSFCLYIIVFLDYLIS